MFIDFKVGSYYLFFFWEKCDSKGFFFDLNDIIDILYRVNSLIIREYDRGYLV